MRLVLLLSVASLASALPYAPYLNSSLSRTSGRLKARAPEITTNVASLKRLPNSGRTSSSKIRCAVVANSTANSTLEFGEAGLLSLLLGQEFATNVTFGSQTFEAIVDTGSSDTWLVETGFTCVDITSGTPLPEGDCYFGPLYAPDSTFVPIANENFNISYGDGEYLNGIEGYDSVTFAGVTVPRQQVALANLAGWNGDDIASGLVGLAFTAITSAFSGTDPSVDYFPGQDPYDINETNQILYSPLINTMFFVDNLTAPEFSLALSRDESSTSYGGLLAIGGTPDINDPTVNATGAFASTAIQVLNIDPIGYTFYTITPDAIVYESALGSGLNNNGVQYIVDSGTTVNYIPTRDANVFNALFDPPARYNSSYGGYVVACDATPPQFGVVVQGQVFATNPYDLILDPGLGDNTCLSGIDDGGQVGPFILGDVFLKNVLAVYNLATLEMQFSARQYYES